MNTENRPKAGSIAALQHFFGRQDGQTLAGFNAEVKALSPADRSYFATELEKAGYPV